MIERHSRAGSSTASSAAADLPITDVEVGRVDNGRRASLLT
jgi:hypothetical protein